MSARAGFIFLQSTWLVELTREKKKKSSWRYGENVPEINNIY